MMNAENCAQMFELFENATPYIKRLMIRGDRGNLVPICSTQKKTAFQGFIVNMVSVKSLYEILFMENRITNFATHSLSQDHLEVCQNEII